MPLIGSIDGLTAGKGGGNVATNSAFGVDALENNTTAVRSTAVGYQAGYSQTAAGYTVNIGSYSGYSYSSGAGNGFNVNIGDSAGYSATGFNNTFIGDSSGSNMTTGSRNTILGRYNGNAGGLDIRTASNHIVLSDGDGNPRAYSTGVGWFFNGGSIVLGGISQTTIYRTGADGSGIHFSTNAGYPANELGTISDNTESWGAGSYRWSVIYAATGSINTSDINEKQDIQDFSSAELAVAQEIKTLFKTFRWKDAVAKKGDSARIHVGVIAQDVQQAFVNHGLDASRYALFCSDTWYEIDGIAMDQDGNKYTAETEGAVEKTRLGVRYDQLLAFVISAL